MTPGPGRPPSAKAKTFEDEAFDHIAVLGNAYGEMETACIQAQSRVAVLELVAQAARELSWVFECRCHKSYTDRGMHEPNALCGEDALLKTALAASDAGFSHLAKDALRRLSETKENAEKESLETTKRVGEVG